MKKKKQIGKLNRAINELSSNDYIQVVESIEAIYLNLALRSTSFVDQCLLV